MAVTDNDIRYFHVADLTKSAPAADGTVLVSGRLAGETVDMDNQKLSKSWLDVEVPKWAERGNIRAMHRPISAGKAKTVTDQGDAWHLVGKIVDAAEVQKVNEGMYTGWSVGIKNPTVVKNADGSETITAGKIIEVSLADNPCDPINKLNLVEKIAAVPSDAEIEATPLDTIVKFVEPAKGDGLADALKAGEAELEKGAKPGVKTAADVAAPDQDGTADAEPDADDKPAKKPKKAVGKSLTATAREIVSMLVSSDAETAGLSLEKVNAFYAELGASTEVADGATLKMLRAADAMLSGEVDELNKAAALKLADAPLADAVDSLRKMVGRLIAGTPEPVAAPAKVEKVAVVADTLPDAPDTDTLAQKFAALEKMVQPDVLKVALQEAVKELIAPIEAEVAEMGKRAAINSPVTRRLFGSAGEPVKDDQRAVLVAQLKKMAEGHPDVNVKAGAAKTLSELGEN